MTVSTIALLPYQIINIYYWLPTTCEDSIVGDTKTKLLSPKALIFNRENTKIRLIKKYKFSIHKAVKASGCDVYTEVDVFRQNYQNQYFQMSAVLQGRMWPYVRAVICSQYLWISLWVASSRAHFWKPVSLLLSHIFT